MNRVVGFIRAATLGYLLTQVFKNTHWSVFILLLLVCTRVEIENIARIITEGYE